MPYLAFYLIFLCLLQASETSLYDTQPADSVQYNAQVPNEIQQTSPEQIQWIRKEYKGNPAQSDMLYYQQREAQKAIQKDSSLQIPAERTPEIEQIAESPWHEFVVSYVFKLVNDAPYGESYKIAVPLVSKAHGKQIAKACEIPTKETYYSLTLYPFYTESQTKASIKKQTQHKLYDFLREYKNDVLLCLIQHNAMIDDTSLTINLESRTKTIASLRAHLLARFSGGVLMLNILEMRENRF
ncbi:hypothetical protein CQA66_02780 [Helicobacter aurati]|uniref:Uncharacterized protein n=1 Tax=Helicobacter aurati TaxID=137778 RepID=A0A3D8J6V9_9HELI|nr:hypothetical protein [Helicobacter aurati]RDU73162.1 hypothetical protein CQA66_02780 [Helicobacter aurati]